MFQEERLYERIPIRQTLLLDPWMEPLAKAGPKPYSDGSETSAPDPETKSQLLILDSEVSNTGLQWRVAVHVVAVLHSVEVPLRQHARGGRSIRTLADHDPVAHRAHHVLGRGRPHAPALSVYGWAGAPAHHLSVG
jgi:hypothetical protein